jgi:hypothetical protein
MNLVYTSGLINEIPAISWHSMRQHEYEMLLLVPNCPVQWEWQFAWQMNNTKFGN